MKPAQIWEVFDWHRGTCFRCEAVGVPVAAVGDITAHGSTLPLYACHLCVFRMQQSHWFATGRRAWPLERLQLPPHSRPRASRPVLYTWWQYRRRTSFRWAERDTITHQ
jgi:hypothetical protein